MKVLILAETCNPEWASLPFFSYSLAKAVASEVDVVVATHVRNEAAIARMGFGDAKVVFIDNEWIAAPLHKLAVLLKKIRLGNWMMRMALHYPSYLAFEYQVWKMFKDKIIKGEFDLIHRISPVSPTLPSPLALWANIPFILGPLNGGLGWPKFFVNELRKEREFVIYLRFLFKLLPYYKSSYDNARVILAAFGHVEKDIPLFDRKKIIRFNELGIDSNVFNGSGRLDNVGFCHFLFVGRLVPYKNPDVVLEAFLSDPALYENHQLTIVGDGSEMRSLQDKLCENVEAAKAISFTGWQTAEQISTLMKKSDVFVFPTIREVGGNVILEAMASGLPCIVPDYGGPAELVNDEVGIKLPVTDKAAMIKNVKCAMIKLAGDSKLRKKMSLAASNFATTQYDWQAKAKELKGIYEDVLR